MRNASVDFVHSNSEIIRFYKDYKLIIFKACKDAGLRRCDWEHIENEMLIKFSMGRIEYDPTRGVKASTYYYVIAKNAASDERKKQRFVELDDKEMEYVPDEHNPFVNIEAKDNYFVVTEALKRLVKKCRDKKKIKILFRNVVEESDRVQLAEEYGVRNDYVSGVKNRWLPCLQELIEEILKEDQEGQLKLSDSDLLFLKQYMMNW